MEEMIVKKKHAYLILTHGNWYVLEKLILLLDDERNDIYIHVDKKVKDFDFSYYQNLPQKSKIVFIDRYDVRWGHVIIVKVELKLLQRALNSGENYSYLHLISGVDLPIKSQDYIHDFFDKNNGKEFIGFSNTRFEKERMDKVHLFPKYIQARERDFFKRGLRWLNELFVNFQRMVGYEHLKSEWGVFVFGSNWVSITSDLAADLLKNKQRFFKLYKHSICSDEVYKQTFVYNSKYKDEIYDIEDELRSCMRYIDWKRGSPYTFRSEDFEMLMNQEMLFARKFDVDTDKEIIDLIYNRIKSQ